MADYLAFADEYGQPNLDTSKANVSTHYIVAAVIVNTQQRESHEAALEEVRKKHFQTGPMKSSSIGSNTRRRLRVLDDLRATGLHGRAVVVDKDLLHEDSGLRFQRPFRRFLNRQLYDELYNTFASLQLIADCVGKSDFMRKFRIWLEEYHQLNTLFSDSAMEWGVTKENVFLQAADIICGSLGHCFDRKKRSPPSQDVQDALTPWVQLREWPWRKTARATARNEPDGIVRAAAEQRANAFIGKHADTKNSALRHQVSCLRYLLFYLRHVDDTAYVHAPEIIASIQVPRAMTRRQFQTGVIAELRDAGILIASDSRGYKLPSTVEDVFRYLRWTNNQVEPMIARAKQMDEALRLASLGKVTLLDNDEFKYLRGPSPLENPTGR